MSDTPKFEVIDRRKYKAEEEEQENARAAAAAPESKKQEEPARPADPPPGPRLVTSQPEAETEPALEAEEAGAFPGIPQPPTLEESREQKLAYDASSQRLEDLVRAQNPGAGTQPPVTFENLVQQLYLSAMLQMGAGTQEGQRPRVDILGAKQTIDLIGILAEKTKGNLSPGEDKMLQAVLFEARMAFLELTNMISMPGVPPTPPPGAGKR